MTTPLATFPGASAPSASTPSAGAGAETKVNERTPFFAALHASSRLPRALMGGTQAMRDAGEKYLPKFPDEKREAWRARLNQTFLYNGYRIAHEAMVGKAFAKPIKLRDDVPLAFSGHGEESPDIGGWAEDIDQCGNHFDVYAQQVFADALHPGLGYILVDAPPREAGDVLSDKQPYFVYISADEDMLGVDVETINGRPMVSRVRFMRRTMARSGWGQVEQERVHVWELVYDVGDEEREGEGLVVQVSTYKPPEDKGDEWVLDTGPTIVRGDGNKPLRRIPIAAFHASEGPFLDDLAWKNLEHWQSSSDQRNILHVVRVAAIFVNGMTRKQFEDSQVAWGPGSAYFSEKSKDEAGMQFVMYEGDGPTIGERDLKHIEEQLVTLSLEPLLNRPGNPTATAKALDQARANSRLLAAVRRFADCLEMAMEYALVDYWGETTGGSIQMNEDFGITISMMEELNALLASRLPTQKGHLPQISHEKLIDEMKRRGSLSEDTVASDEWDKIIKEWKDLAAIGLGPLAGRTVEDGEGEEDEGDDEDAEEDSDDES